MTWGLVQFAGGWALIFAAGWLAGSGWSDLRAARWLRDHPVTEVGPPPRCILDTMTPDELARYALAQARSDEAELDGVPAHPWLTEEARARPAQESMPWPSPWGPAGHATKEE